jgi:hypothetical protein
VFFLWSIEACDDVFNVSPGLNELSIGPSPLIVQLDVVVQGDELAGAVESLIVLHFFPGSRVSSGFCGLLRPESCRLNQSNGRFV